MSHAQPTLVLCEIAAAPDTKIFSYSPFCEKVHRALRHVGLNYERRHGRFPGVFKKYNPLGKVPVLLVDDQPLPDSSRILQWLLKEYPDAFNQGLNEAEVAEAWTWEEFGDHVLNGFLIATRWADERNWPRVKQSFFGEIPAPLRFLISAKIRKDVLKGLYTREFWTGRPEQTWERLQTTLDRLEARAPKQGLWMGDELSVADIGLFSQLQGLRAAFTPWQKEQVEARPTLTAYLDRVHDITQVHSQSHTQSSTLRAVA